MATGAGPRRLPGTEGMPGVHVLRTLDDCLAIRADLESAGPGARVVVIGAGFIGSEVAATCHGLGARVTVVEALPTPLAGVLGDQMGEACAQLHRDQGVDRPHRGGRGRDRVRPRRPTPLGGPSGRRVRPRRRRGGGRDRRRPRRRVAGRLGPDLDNGVVCDRHAVRRRRVVAAGDVARWTRPGPASSSGSSTGPTPPRAVPPRPATCWPVGRPPSPTIPCRSSGPTSTQTKIQVIGLPGPDDEVVVVDGSVEEGQLVALYRRGDRLRAVLAFSRPRQLMAYRPLLAAGASFDEALALARGREPGPTAVALAGAA